jgi:glutamine synthetase
MLRETLGEHVFDTIVTNKKIEWAEYRSQVTPFEIERYLPLL